jgi:DNA-binding transcriptional LysR family regulator
MNVSHLRCFALLAEELHMTRAAQRLNMAQPSLSRIIRGLEEELGFVLFDRSKKHQMILTPAGRAFYKGIAPLLLQYEQTVQAARKVNQGEGGELVVGYTGAAMFSVLPAITLAFRRYPTVDLILQDISTYPLRARLKALREHRLDVALLSPALNAPGIAHEYVCRASLVVALPASHPLASQCVISLADLANESWVRWPRPNNPPLYDAEIALCQQAGFEPRIVQTAHQPHSIISLVASGVGVALVTEWTAQGITHPEVVYRPLCANNYYQELHALWDKNNPSVLLKTFIQVVHEVNDKSKSMR